MSETAPAAFESGFEPGFGSPYVIVEGEPFSGADRLPQLGRWREAGGF